MTRRVTLWVYVVAGGAVAVALVGCGAGHGGGDPVAQAASNSVAASGVSGPIRFSVRRIGRPRPATIKGIVESSGDRRRASITEVGASVSSGYRKLARAQLQFVVIGSDEYIGGSPFNARLANPKEHWIKLHTVEGDPPTAPGLTLVDLTQTPIAYLQLVKSASRSFALVRNEVIDGYHATRYHALVSHQLFANAEGNRAPEGQPVPSIDIWVDPSRKIRRLTVTYESPATATGPATRVRILLGLHYGRVAPITAPLGSEVFDASHATPAVVRQLGLPQ